MRTTCGSPTVQAAPNQASTTRTSRYPTTRPRPRGPGCQLSETGWDDYFDSLDNTDNVTSCLAELEQNTLIEDGDDANQVQIPITAGVTNVLEVTPDSPLFAQCSVALTGRARPGDDAGDQGRRRGWGNAHRAALRGRQQHERHQPECARALPAVGPQRQCGIAASNSPVRRSAAQSMLPECPDAQPIQPVRGDNHLRDAAHRSQQRRTASLSVPRHHPVRGGNSEPDADEHTDRVTSTPTESPSTPSESPRPRRSRPDPVETTTVRRPQFDDHRSHRAVTRATSTGVKPEAYRSSEVSPGGTPSGRRLLVGVASQPRVSQRRRSSRTERLRCDAAHEWRSRRAVPGRAPGQQRRRSNAGS